MHNLKSYINISAWGYIFVRLSPLDFGLIKRDVHLNGCSLSGLHIQPLIRVP